MSLATCWKLRPRMWWDLWGPLVVVLLGTVLFGSSAPASAADTLSFSIPTERARYTLPTFQQQANVWVSFDYDSVADIMTNSIDGELEPRAAIARMLQGTPLSFEFISGSKDRDTVIVRLDERKHQLVAGNEGPPSDGTRRDSDRNSHTPHEVHAELLEEVRVTGTHIHATDPVGSVLNSYYMADIEQSGSATLAGFMQTLPQTFGGGASEDTHLGTEAGSNTGFGVGVNLRGLGSRATLVLVNGRRPAPSGSIGEFTDISLIPTVAIKRVDVLTDGASAAYGADAVCGVVNIVTLDGYSGAETLAQIGHVTEGAMGEERVSQLFGDEWASGNGVVAVEYYHHDALPAGNRPVAQSDLVPWGGTNFDSIFSNPGTVTTNARDWAIPAGQDGRSLTPSRLVPGTENLANQYQGAQILPSQRRISLYASARERFADSITFFGDALWSNRRAGERTDGQGAGLPVPSSNPFYINPSGGTGPITVDYNFRDDLGFVDRTTDVQSVNIGGGIEIALGRDWQVGAILSYATEQQKQLTTGETDYAALYAALADPDPSTAFDPFGDGSHTNPQTLAAIRAQPRFDMLSEVRGVSLSADGPVLQLPSGALKGALGAEFRQQVLRESTSEDEATSYSFLQRRLWAVFAESIAPVVGPSDSRIGLHRLEVSAAVRYERYSDAGDSTTPRFGLRWLPLRGVEIGGTWAKSSRPPNLGDLDESRNNSLITNLQDPQSATHSTTTLVVYGAANSHLRNEQATNLSVNAQLTPELIPGFRAALTYFHIDFTNRIESLLIEPNVLADPRYSILVTRNPSQALRDEICSSSIFEGVADACRLAPVQAVLDNRLRNIDRLQTRGFDFSESYKLESALGSVRLDTSGTYILSYVATTFPVGPVSELNTIGNPINLRLHGSISWDHRNLGVTVATNYANSYRDNTSVPSRTVDSWTTVDLQLRFAFRDSSSGLNHTDVALTVKNVFDRNPPFVNNAAAGLGYDQENADLTNRFLTLAVTKRW